MYEKQAPTLKSDRVCEIPEICDEFDQDTGICTDKLTCAESKAMYDQHCCGLTDVEFENDVLLLLTNETHLTYKNDTLIKTCKDVYNSYHNRSSECSSGCF